jgi:hypothetical protein
MNLGRRGTLGTSFPLAPIRARVWGGTGKTAPCAPCPMSGRLGRMGRQIRDCGFGGSDDFR